MKIDAKNLYYTDLNKMVRDTKENEVFIENAIGQRFIGDSSHDKFINIKGIPGNALGAYLDGSTIRVHGNTQDATGDTMNNGAIIIEGSSGDATGYGMRGGRIFIRENAGYRAGIHMKAYKENVPVLVIGNKAGDFLGEYQAGGIIIVLGEKTDALPVGLHCATGMHGGKIFIRSRFYPDDLPNAVECRKATAEDIAGIAGFVNEFADAFGIENNFLDECFYVLIPNTKNPYKQLYTHN